MINNSPIGVFDSGIGGLTVFSAIKEHLPNETLVYLGDTARVPYGIKSDETVVRYSLEDAAFLERQNVKAIVVACNTASSFALPALRERFDVPIMGVVEPGAKAAISASRSGRVGVVGTQATVDSGAYIEALKNFDRRVRVVSEACPLFVPLIEEGWLEGEVPLAVAKQYLNRLGREHVDVLILGCTHYPLLKGIIGQVMGPGVELIDSGEAIANVLKTLLEEQGLCSDSSSEDPDKIFVTDVPAKFKEVASRFLGHDLPEVQRVTL